MKQKALLLEPPKFDVSQLYAKYDVEMIFDTSEEVRGYVSHPELLYKMLHRWATHNFNPATDLFVLTGNQTLLVACSLAISTAHPSSDIRFLRFDAHTQTYAELVIYGRRTDERSETAGPTELPSDPAHAS